MTAREEKTGGGQEGQRNKGWNPRIRVDCVLEMTESNLLTGENGGQEARIHSPNTTWAPEM